MFRNCRIAGKNIDPNAYHGANCARGSKEFAMSPSALRKFAACPEEWIVEGKKLYELRAKLVSAQDRKEREQLRRRIDSLEGTSQSQQWGKLLDARLLTPEAFQDSYVVRPEEYTTTVLKCPSCGSVTEAATCRKCKVAREETKVAAPWNGRAEECQAWADAQALAGRSIISSTILELCDEAIARLLSKPIINKCIECSDKQVHVVGEWHDKATGLVVPVQCLLDLAPRLDTEYVPGAELMWPKILADLKTCATADLVEFGRRVHRYGWHIQAAFDLALYVAATGEDRTDWLIVGQKNYGVWQPFKRLVNQDFLALGTSEYARMMANYCWCVKNQKWPDHDETDEAIDGCGVAAPDPWMASQAQFAPHYEFDDEQPTPGFQPAQDDNVPRDPLPLHELEVQP